MQLPDRYDWVPLAAAEYAVAVREGLARAHRFADRSSQTSAQVAANNINGRVGELAVLKWSREHLGATAITDVADAANNPTAWVRGANTVRVIYSLMPASDWPAGRAVSAVQVVDQRGSVLGEWVDADRGHGPSTYRPAGPDFVAIPQYSGLPDGASSARKARHLVATRVAPARSLSHVRGRG